MAKKVKEKSCGENKKRSESGAKSDGKSIKGDLDALFKKNKKSKKIKKAERPEQSMSAEVKPSSDKKPKQKAVPDTTKPPKISNTGPRKYTKEGYKIYTTEELKLG